jgi:hypothetical protein
MIRIALPILVCGLLSAGEAQIVLFKLDDVDGVSPTLRSQQGSRSTSAAAAAPWRRTPPLWSPGSTR